MVSIHFNHLISNSITLDYFSTTFLSCLLPFFFFFSRECWVSIPSWRAPSKPNHRTSVLIVHRSGKAPICPTNTNSNRIFSNAIDLTTKNTFAAILLFPLLPRIIWGNLYPAIPVPKLLLACCFLTPSECIPLQPHHPHLQIHPVLLHLLKIHSPHKMPPPRLSNSRYLLSNRRYLQRIQLQPRSNKRRP